jgi:hypothetical protein
VGNASDKVNVDRADHDDAAAHAVDASTVSVTPPLRRSSRLIVLQSRPFGTSFLRIRCRQIAAGPLAVQLSTFNLTADGSFLPRTPHWTFTFPAP